MKPKYESLAELVSAMGRDEVNAGETLYLDNDSTDMYSGDGHVKLFSMHPAELLEQALDLLGVNWEPV